MSMNISNLFKNTKGKGKTKVRVERNDIGISRSTALTKYNLARDTSSLQTLVPPSLSNFNDALSSPVLQQEEEVCVQGTWTRMDCFEYSLLTVS